MSVPWPAGPRPAVWKFLETGLFWCSRHDEVRWLARAIGFRVANLCIRLVTGTCCRTRSEVEGTCRGLRGIRNEPKRTVLERSQPRPVRCPRWEVALQSIAIVANECTGVERWRLRR